MPKRDAVATSHVPRDAAGRRDMRTGRARDAHRTRRGYAGRARDLWGVQSAFCRHQLLHDCDGLSSRVMASGSLQDFDQISMGFSSDSHGNRCRNVTPWRPPMCVRACFDSVLHAFGMVSWSACGASKVHDSVNNFYRIVMDCLQDSWRRNFFRSLMDFLWNSHRDFIKIDAERDAVAASHVRSGLF